MLGFDPISELIRDFLRVRQNLHNLHQRGHSFFPFHPNLAWVHSNLHVAYARKHEKRNVLSENKRVRSNVANLGLVEREWCLLGQCLAGAEPSRTAAFRELRMNLRTVREPGPVTRLLELFENARGSLTPEYADKCRE